MRNTAGYGGLSTCLICIYEILFEKTAFEYFLE